ncbi:TonB-dependent receptor [Sphingomonas sp. ASV193]|uniref:TonB-dependent receptor n=1 Tax=Sphingomonas sp. ASV193 TaxID=3144405 RepID=UPI0032E881F2
MLLLAQAVAAPAAPPRGDEPTSVGTGAKDSSEIVVTARRKRETAQTVPLAISVVGGDHIDATGAFNVGRLQQLTPTLQFYSSNPRNTAVNIRGIGVPFGLTNDGIEQGVGIYVDDVYFSRVASSTFDFLDVDRIEVLRGPQGTLYGKNTSAGAINITSRQPEFHWGGRAEASVGNLGFVQLKGALTGPLSDTLAFRLAFSRTSRDGTIRNVRTGGRVNNQDNLGTRAQLLWKPSSRFQLTLAGDYNRQNPDCCVQLYVRTGLTQRPLNRQYDALAAAFGYAVPSTDAFDRLTDQDTPSHAGNKTGGLSARAKWDVGIGTITSISAWRFWDWDPSSDRDFLGLPITTASQNPSKQDQYTQELRFNRSGRTIDLSLGAFAFRQTVRTRGLQVQGSAASRWLLNPGNVAPGSSACSPATANACNPAVLDGLTATNDIRLANDSAALFGQLAWKVTDRLTIQPGIRLNYDLKNGHYSSVVTDKAGRLVVFGPTDSVTRDRLSVLTPQQFDARYKAWNLSYDLTAYYRPTRALMVYATYARSFKSGGINLNGVPNDAAGNPLLAAATVKPETIDHLEAGVKSQWDRGRVTANLALFRTDIRDFQALVNNGQLGVLRGYLANAGKVRSRGAEWDLSWRPSRRFNAYLNGAYTDARYRRFADAPCPPELGGGANSPPACDISGQVLPGVSRWSLSFGGEASRPVRIGGAAAEVYVGGDANARTRFSSNPSPSAYTWIAGYTLANFRLGLRTPSIDGFLWIRNAFDTRYFEQLAVASGNTGLIVGQPGDPRTFGVTVKKLF